MNPDLAVRLSKEYPFFCQPNLVDLPDGWVKPLINMWDRLYALSAIDATSDRALIPVSLRYEVYPNYAMAFASPTMLSGWWTDARRKEVFEALDDFYGATKTICSVCGKSGSPVRFADVHLILCAEHKSEARANAVENVGRLERAQTLHDDVAILFPPDNGDAINLVVPAYLEDLLAWLAAGGPGLPSGFASTHADEIEQAVDEYLRSGELPDAWSARFSHLQGIRHRQAITYAKLCISKIAAERARGDHDD